MKWLRLGVAAANAHMIIVTSMIAEQAMRAVVALGLLITLCVSANAAGVHHAKSRPGPGPEVRFALNQI